MHFFVTVCGWSVETLEDPHTVVGTLASELTLTVLSVYMPWFWVTLPFFFVCCIVSDRNISSRSKISSFAFGILFRSRECVCVYILHLIRVYCFVVSFPLCFVTMSMIIMCFSFRCNFLIFHQHVFFPRFLSFYFFRVSLFCLFVRSFNTPVLST